MEYNKSSRRIGLCATSVKCICMKADAVLHKKYAALYCKRCNAWIEPTCNKFDCSYCKDRPLKPMNDKGQECD